MAIVDQLIAHWQHLAALSRRWFEPVCPAPSATDVAVHTKETFRNVNLEITLQPQEKRPPIHDGKDTGIIVQVAPHWLLLTGTSNGCLVDLKSAKTARLVVQVMENSAHAPTSFRLDVPTIAKTVQN